MQSFFGLRLKLSSKSLQIDGFRDSYQNASIPADIAVSGSNEGLRIW